MRLRAVHRIGGQVLIDTQAGPGLEDLRLIVLGSGAGGRQRSAGATGELESATQYSIAVLPPVRARVHQADDIAAARIELAVQVLVDGRGAVLFLELGQSQRIRKA